MKQLLSVTNAKTLFPERTQARERGYTDNATEEIDRAWAISALTRDANDRVRVAERLRSD